MNDATTTTEAAGYSPLTIKKHKSNDGPGLSISVMNAAGERVGLATWGINKLSGGYNQSACAYGPEWTREQRETFAALEASGQSMYPPPYVCSGDKWSFGKTTNGLCNQRADAVARARAEFKNAVAWLEARLGQKLNWRSVKY